MAYDGRSRWRWWLWSGAIVVIVILWFAGVLPWLLGAAVAAVILWGAWWVWWQLPKRQLDSFPISDPKDRAEIEDNFRKTISQLIGGGAVLIGAGFAYLQFTEQQRASREQFLAQQTASQEQFERQQRAAQNLLISNQVSKGFELLGNTASQIGQRLGGIYALEGVMNGSEQYHQPVLEALCAFVRDYTKSKTDDAPPATDIQAALTVIGRRKAGAGVVDLGGVHIPKAVLGAADLTGAT
jgi:hypothetical protein